MPTQSDIALRVRSALARAVKVRIASTLVAALSILAAVALIGERP